MSESLKIPVKTIPANFGPMQEADGNARIKGPCGDTMEFWVAVKEGKITNATYTTDGCRHSIVAGSAAAILAVGKELDFIKEFKPEYVLALVGEFPEEFHHCALLSVNALKAAVNDCKKKNCSGNCDSCHMQDCGDRKPQAAAVRKPAGKVSAIKRKILVLSGKGGVGKSTVAVNLAFSFASAGRRVGLLDVDLHGPSIPKMLNIQDETIGVSNSLMIPVDVGGLKVMSIGFLTKAAGDPLIWRGPMKAVVIRQFVEDVEWGPLDYLIVDCPPGTGDEPLSVAQILGEVSGAVVVTTPQDVAVADVRKSVNFCRELKVPVLGIVENMSGFTCPGCGETFDLFKKGGGMALAGEMDVPFLGSIPLDPDVVSSGDEGRPCIKIHPEASVSRAVMDVFSKIFAGLEKNEEVLCGK